MVSTYCIFNAQPIFAFSYIKMKTFSNIFSLQILRHSSFYSLFCLWIMMFLFLFFNIHRKMHRVGQKDVDHISNLHGHFFLFVSKNPNKFLSASVPCPLNLCPCSFRDRDLYRTYRIFQIYCNEHIEVWNKTKIASWKHFEEHVEYITRYCNSQTMYFFFKHIRLFTK